MTPKLERVTRLQAFRVDLNNALIEASCMSAACASSMIERRFDEYCDLWPFYIKGASITRNNL